MLLSLSLPDGTSPKLKVFPLEAATDYFIEFLAMCQIKRKEESGIGRSRSKRFQMK